jgi:hypothetical protein
MRYGGATGVSYIQGKMRYGGATKSQRPVSCTSILRPWWFSLNIYYFAKYKNWDRTQPWWYGAYICDFQISAVSLQKANVDWENRNQSIWLLISDLFIVLICSCLGPLCRHVYAPIYFCTKRITNLNPIFKLTLLP